MDSNDRDLREVWRQDVGALTALLQSGHPIEPDALAGKSFRGVSIGLPPIVIRFTWLTFRKRFWRRQGDGELCGHNERLEQTGTEGTSVPMVDTDGPIVFGPFVVTASAPNPFGVSTGLLLDYVASPGLASACARARPIGLSSEGSSGPVARGYLPSVPLGPASNA